MSRRFGIILFLVFLGLSAGRGGTARAEEVAKVGVLPFRVYSVDPEKRKTWPDRVARIISAELAKDERIVLIEEDLIRRALEEVGPGEGEEQAAREVGKRVGADYMVLGSVTEVTGSISVDARVLDVYREGVLASVFATGKTPAELESAVRLAGREVNIRLLHKELISKVLIEGNRAIEETAIRAKIKTKEGDLYAPGAIREDLKAIYQMGYFKDVKVEMRDWDRQKALVFVVDEKPMIKEIKFSGNKNIKTSDLLETIDLKPRTVLNLNSVQENVAKIVKKYRDEAYFSAEVKYDLETPRPGDVVVHFKIKENQKVRISRITFAGNAHFSDKTLRKALPETKEKNLLSFITSAGTYKEETLERDLDNVIAYYLSKGFLEVKVGKPRMNMVKKGLEITIPVEEGQQFRVGVVDIRGDLLFPKEELFKSVPLAVGEIFNREKVREAVSNLTDKYADKGYAFVDVSPQTIPHPQEHIADLILDIRQGSKVYFERINLQGNTKTRDHVIRRDVAAVEGELYSLAAIKRTRDSLNYLGYFKEVNIDTKKGSADDKMVVNVRVQERPTGAISAGAGYSSIDKLVALLSVSQNNLFGTGQSVRASAQLGSISQYFLLSYTEPRLFDTRVLAGADLYNNYRDYLDYTIRATGGVARMGFPLLEYLRLYTQYKYEKIDVYNIKDTASDLLKQQAGSSTTSSVYLGIRRDTRNHRFDPTKGNDNTLSFEYAGGPLGGTNYFTKYQFSSAWFYTPFWNTTFSARGRIDYIIPYGGHPIPLYERFRLGGIYTLRGFKSYTVGPRTSTGEVIGGDKDLLFNFEMIFPISSEIKLKGVVFFDAGNSWDVGQNYDISDLRTSVGFGFRWISPVGPLRLEWGYNLKPRFDEPHSSFDFTIGGFF